MATKKQQKRRDKAVRHGLGRHAFEYVEVDEEGNEIVSDAPDKPARGTAKRGASGKGTAKPRREPKAPQPPSLKRLGKRTAIFVPIILLLTLSQGKLYTQDKLIQALMFAVVFVGIMWVSDSLIYKMWVKRQAKAKAASGGKG